jgi:two-component system CheB/CheR fusion protein
MNTKKKEHMSKELFCVGIGASAGGLEAIETFFTHLPEKPDLAFVIVQHLSPDYKSLMGELLSRYTKLSIHRVEDGIQVEANNIYLIPPRKNMTVYDKRLYLTEQTKSHNPNLPIDIFFRSMAQDFGKNAIGIVLSGTGSDGSLGIKAIKEQGGMIMAQNEESAKFDGMPRSSIATGMVDYILPPDEMPETLLKFVKHPHIVKPETKPKDLSSDESLLKILQIVRNRVGVDFTFYKPNTILRRLEKRLGINQIDTFKEYLDFLEHSPKEAHILYKDLLIGVTQFFRDQEAFTIVKNKVLPLVFDPQNQINEARIWCAGCSTGEEAYSLAMLMSEYLEEQKYDLDIKIFATDLDKEHLEQASAGIYPESIITDVSPERLDKYFIKTPSGYQVNEKIRRMVIYAQQNIIKDPPFSKIHLITCRNMLIYLNQEMQRKILSMFYYSLVPEGALFLGSSESLGEMSEGFEVLSNKWKIFKQKTGFKPPYITNYMLPLSKQHKPGLPRQNFDYLFADHHSIRDNVLTDMLEAILPPSLIINEEFKIVHLFKDVNDFISLPTGKATFDVLSMVSKDLSVVIGSMLNKVMKEGKDVFFNDVKLKNKKNRVNLSAKPITDKATKKRYIILSFEKASEKDVQPLASKDFDIKSEITERYSGLEKELQFTKENLQATIEELETSNEELQSTNEELVASNEELQSTNEELQSVNEELYTVNTEYQNKIEELTQLNNDMNNLLRNTNIGILYLDRKLQIRKYTPLITRVINVMDMDIGRPIKHISLNVDYKGFADDVKEVRDTLEIIEKEVKDEQGNWNLVRIQPYRTLENAVDGITISINDISRLMDSKEKYAELFNSMGQGVVYQNAEGKITSANRAAEKILGLSIDQMMGRSSIDDRWHAIKEDGSEYPGEDHPAMIALKTGKPILNKIMGVFHPEENKHKWILINAIPQFNKGEKQPYQAFTTFDDISRIIEQEKHILKEKDLFLRILDNSPIGKLVVDKMGYITFANKRAESMMGVARAEMEKRKYNDSEWKIRDMNGNEIAEKDLPFRQIMDEQIEIKGYRMMLEDAKGRARSISINASPMFNEKGETDGGVFSIEEVEHEH